LLNKLVSKPLFVRCYTLFVIGDKKEPGNRLDHI